MSNKGTKARVAKAFAAMKDLGISEDKVKPVLKVLLKLYDKDWKLIEEENYRALADAIFESEESEALNFPKEIVNNEAAEYSMNIVTREDDEVEEEPQETEQLRRPLKRLRLKYRVGQTSSQMPNNGVTTSLIKAKEEPQELPETLMLTGPLEIMESAEPNTENIENTNVESQDVRSQFLGKKKEKQAIRQPSGINRNEQNVPSKRRKPIPESSSPVVRFKEPIVERPDTVLPLKQKNNTNPSLKMPKDEPITDDMPLLEAPLAVIHPYSSSRKGTTRVSCEPDGVASPSELRNNGNLVTMSDKSSSNMDIASSPCGEVKISLNCDLALQKPGFQIPTLEAVLKAVEDKCLKSFKILDPNFSMMDIMKEMCQTFVKLGSEFNSQSQEAMDMDPASEQTIDVSHTSEPAEEMDATPALDLMETTDVTLSSESIEIDVTPSIDLLDRCKSPLYNSLNGSVDHMPIAPINSPGNGNGLDDVSQLSKNGGEDEIGSVGQEQEKCDDVSLVVVPEVIRSVQNDPDIAKGQEKVVIMLVNEVNKESLPSFHYIPQNALFQNANVTFSLARIDDKNCCSTCSGNCLSLASPCACAIGDDFAYTKDGLVKEEFIDEFISKKRDTKKNQFFCEECPLERAKGMVSIESCKGHLLMKFIKECWLKCGCNKKCGNRVVQRGVSHNLQVFMTPEGKGWGLRPLVDLPKGAFVCEYVGEILTKTELFDRVLPNPEGEKYSHPVVLDADWCVEGVVKDENTLVLDATRYGNVARFINHRCYDSNLVEIPVEVETPDHHYYHVALFTTRNVEAMEELTWDYGIDFDNPDHPIKPFRCLCKSNFCRNIKRFRSNAAARR